ncbi:MAG: hypothetical protein R3C11_03690 [Planctomycetaceae bacterium]
MGGGFPFLAFWIWHRSTRPLPQKAEVAAYNKYLEQQAEQHPYLFTSVYVVNTIREKGESIPKLGDLFTAFLFFWILPLYMLFIYATAYHYRRLQRLFCISYWLLWVVSPWQR